MKLYFAPRSRTVRPRWLLEELEVPYELVTFDPSKQENVPALVDGDVTFFEPSAICLLYLADRFPEKNLAPPPGSAERAHYYRWMSFAEGSIEPLVMEVYRHGQLPEEQKAGAQEALARSRPRLNEVLTILDAELNGRAHLVGGRFTAVDVMLASLLHLAHNLKLLEGHPRLFEYVLSNTKRPASRRAVQPPGG